MDRHSIGKGHSNPLPFHTDIVQRPDGTSTIGDPPMCLRTPSFTAHSRHANPIHCQCSDKPLPIQYQSNVNLMSILCQFNLQSHNSSVPIHRQSDTDPCQSYTNRLPSRFQSLPTPRFNVKQGISIPIHHQSRNNPKPICQSQSDKNQTNSCRSGTNSPIQHKADRQVKFQS